MAKEKRSVITIFVNADGYYITGEGIETARRCSPALTKRGDPILLPLHHTYGILLLALKELIDAAVKDDVMVYNDSRIIDEINGFVQPLDDTCEQWLQVLHRDIVPRIRSVVFFRKKSPTHVNAVVQSGHQIMLSNIDQVTKIKLAEQAKNTAEKNLKRRKTKLVERLKKSWFSKGE